jgi:hypothetical protein
MTRQEVRYLVRACETADIPCELYEGYSGQSMGEHTTWGVVVASPLLLITATARHASTYPEEYIPDLTGLRMDNLGKDFIVY